MANCHCRDHKEFLEGLRNGLELELAQCRFILTTHTGEPGMQVIDMARGRKVIADKVRDEINRSKAERRESASKAARARWAKEHS